MRFLQVKRGVACIPNKDTTVRAGSETAVTLKGALEDKAEDLHDKPLIGERDDAWVTS